MLKYMEGFFPSPQRVPPGYQEFLTWLDTAKQALWTSAIPKPEDPRMNEGNKIYFVMENIEEQFLSIVTSTILEHHQVDSILWLHDGIWFAPPADHRLIELAIDEARRRLALPSVRAKYHSLAPARAALLKALPLPTALTSSTAMRVQLHSEYGQYVIPDRRTPAPLDSALRQVKATATRKRKFDPLQPSLQQFLARKAKKAKTIITID